MPSQPGHEPGELAEHVADHAMRAAVDFAAEQGNPIKEIVVLTRLQDDRAAIAAHSEIEPVDSAWLATELLYRFKMVMKSMGKEVHVGALEDVIGRG